MDDILVSIIVPIYNTSKYLDKCIQSILNQTIKCKEIILIDDGSTDNSLEICKKYHEKYKNIKIYSNKNSGLGATRNFGILKSKGRYVGFVDSDDYIEKGMYEHLLNMSIENSSDISICGHEKIYNKDNLKSIQNEGMKKEEIINKKEEIIKNYLLGEISSFACDKVFKKDFLVKNNIMFPENCFFEDVNMVLRSLFFCNRIVISNIKYYKYVQRSNSITYLGTEQHLKDFKNQVNNFYEFINNNYNYKDINLELKNSKFVYTNMFLKFIKGLYKENEVEKFFQELPKKIIIFGASSAGKLMKYYCDMFNIEVLYFCDNDRLKWGNKLENIYVISPKILSDFKNRSCGIYIASIYYKEIYEQLQKMDLEDKIVDLNIF